MGVEHIAVFRLPNSSVIQWLVPLLCALAYNYESYSSRASPQTATVTHCELFPLGTVMTTHNSALVLIPIIQLLHVGDTS